MILKSKGILWHRNPTSSNLTIKEIGKEAMSSTKRKEICKGFVNRILITDLVKKESWYILQ